MGDWQAWLGPAVVGALISALVTAFGWFVPHWRERQREEARRTRRAADMRRAIRAEIASHLLRHDETSYAAHRDKMVRLFQSVPDFVPFIPRDSLDDSVYRASLGEITFLPESAIDAVLLYYTQLNTVRNFIEDLRSREFAELSPERKAAMYSDYIAMKITSAGLARRALEAVSESADQPLSLGGALAGPAPAPLVTAEGKARSPDRSSY